MNTAMKAFGHLINRLMAGESLSKEESRLALLQILNNEVTEIQQGAFLAAITAKGPVPEEIAGVWQAIYEVDTAAAAPQTPTPLVDNCGTGMDAFKSFNISTAAAVVAAAGGVPMARHGARAITSRCGTVDLCEALGVDVECPVGTVTASIEKANIGLFNGMSPTIHPQALFRILSQMGFGSILNIAASLANPARPLLGVRGVYAADMVVPVARTMQAIGFAKAMVFHGSGINGSGGMDELSPLGNSLVAELTADGHIRTDTIHPSDLGLNLNASMDAIAAGTDAQSEALRLLRIFSGQDRGPLFETICLNAAPIFYIAGGAPDLKSGLEKARDLIDRGRALDCLQQWVATQNIDPAAGQARLTQLLTQIDHHG